MTPVYCYTDYPSGELFVNGKSQGRITKNPAERLDRYRLRWNDVRYEPGEVKVIVYDADGRKAGEQTIKTPSQPAKLQLDAWTAHNPESPEPPEYPDNPGKPEKPEYPGSIAPAKAPLLHADGSDLAFITVSLTDAEGTLIPDASDQLTFEVTGAGRFEAACNGDATSLEPFTLPTMRLFSGQLVVIIRSGRQPGDITLKVTDQQRGLSQSITVKAI